MGAVAEALDKLGWKPDSSEIEVAYWIAKGELDKCVEIGTPAVEPLIAALKHEEWWRRRYVAKALGEIGDPRAVKPLIALLDYSYDREGVHEAAAQALINIGALAVEPLVATLKNKSSLVVVEVLGKIGDSRAVEPLISILKDENSDVRKTAAEAFGEIGDPQAVEPLIDALEDKDWGVRLAAVRALGKIGDRRAMESLLLALKEEEELVRKAAAEALRQLGWEGA